MDFHGFPTVFGHFPPGFPPAEALYTNRERSWLMQNLEKLSATIGACERLVQTPVPLSPWDILHRTFANYLDNIYNSTCEYNTYMIIKIVNKS